MANQELKIRCQRCGSDMEMRDPAPGGPWKPDQFWVCNNCGRHFWTTYAAPPKPAGEAGIPAKPTADTGAAPKPTAAAGAAPAKQTANVGAAPAKPAANAGAAPPKPATPASTAAPAAAETPAKDPAEAPGNS